MQQSADLMSEGRRSIVAGESVGQEGSAMTPEGTPFGRHRADVEAMCASGESLGEIEGKIDAATYVDGDQRAALWLVAWASQGRPPAQRASGVVADGGRVRL